MGLKDLVIDSSKRWPNSLAVKGPDGALTYDELDKQANRVARALDSLRVRKGDRVGVWLDKSVRGITVMQGILRLGAAYVPLDPKSPAARVKTIVSDCGMRALVSTANRTEKILGDGTGNVATFCIDSPVQGLSWDDLESFSDEPIDGSEVSDDDLAYILYTSGSTGKPKGVCISNRNALAFVNWAVDEIKANRNDRFSNHAPFHFDLSVLDLYGAFSVGASVFLVPEMLSYMPKRLVSFIQNEKISIWYSVPSAIVLMMEQGGLLEESDIPLCTLIFAGEPFPIKPLRRLFKSWPSVRFLNFYGPTETNVCTSYEVKEIKEDRTRPVPIGRACSSDQVWAVKENGSVSDIGEEGELMVSGPTVMLGYWGKPPHGNRPYATGDLVRLEKDGNYVYIGRRDHMVKVRGYRVELGEIEAALGQHLDIHGTAVVVSGSGMDARIVAFVVFRENRSLSLLDVKRHCAEHLPRYMIVDDICPLDELPLTRNGKVDRFKLTQQAESIRMKKKSG